MFANRGLNALIGGKRGVRLAVGLTHVKASTFVRRIWNEAVGRTRRQLRDIKREAQRALRQTDRRQPEVDMRKDAP